MTPFIGKAKELAIGCSGCSLSLAPLSRAVMHSIDPNNDLEVA
jgi:hypothetical protein